MSVLYIALPVALIIAVAALAAFAWSLRSGQLDDLETPPYRAIFDEVETPRKKPSNNERNILMRDEFAGPISSEG